MDVETYLRSIKVGTWYNLKDLPVKINPCEIYAAAREQILKPDFEIILGRYQCTFKVIIIQPDTLQIMERIQKAV